MTPIKWSEQAVADLKSLRCYIAKDNPAAARQVEVFAGWASPELVA